LGVRNTATRKRAIAAGYRSGLEEAMAENLKERGISFTYEEDKIKWLDSKERTYTPDFVLENGIIVETKGRFVSADSTKRLRSSTPIKILGSYSVTHELSFTREPRAPTEVGVRRMASCIQIR
jgi:hypothetical protein